MNFGDVHVKLDKGAQDVDKVFNSEFLSAAKQASDFASHALFFIYYSGHGVNRDGETLGIAVDGSIIHLEQYVAQLSARANTFTVALFDCCRVNEIKKGSGMNEAPR